MRHTEAIATHHTEPDMSTTTTIATLNPGHGFFGTMGLHHDSDQVAQAWTIAIEAISGRLSRTQEWARDYLDGKGGRWLADGVQNILANNPGSSLEDAINGAITQLIGWGEI